MASIPPVISSETAGIIADRLDEKAKTSRRFGIAYLACAAIVGVVTITYFGQLGQEAQRTTESIRRFQLEVVQRALEPKPELPATNQPQTSAQPQTPRQPLREPLEATIF